MYNTIFCNIFTTFEPKTTKQTVFRPGFEYLHLPGRPRCPIGPARQQAFQFPPSRRAPFRFGLLVSRWRAPGTSSLQP